MQSLSILVLWAATIGIILVDRKKRAESTNEDMLPMNEPGLGVLFALAVLCNIGCLPYYFLQTRGGAKGFLMGIGFFAGCFVLTVAASVVLAGR